MKKVPILITVLFVMTMRSASAEGYVLPYPSYMPGNALYKIRQVIERLQEHWYFGDMAKVKYHLKMADKYLVESKTLFEYGQMKLAVAALNKSNYYFANAVLYERDVTRDKKDDGTQKNQLKEAGEKHIAVIDDLQKVLPEKIEWQEEKKEKEELSLMMLFKQAKVIREYAKN